MENNEKQEIQDLIESTPYLSKKRQANRQKAIDKGFTDEYHMEGWLYFNRVSNEQFSGYDVDVLHKTDGGFDE